MTHFLSDLSALIHTQSNRLDWDEYFMSLALLISCRSPSERLHVGAVIVRDNRVVASGYNGFPAGAPHHSVMLDGHEINTIHAEQNAISDAAKRGVSIDGSTIYITHYPCVHCAKYIISSGIRAVFYFEDYRNQDVVATLFRESRVVCQKMITKK